MPVLYTGGQKVAMVYIKHGDASIERRRFCWGGSTRKIEEECACDGPSRRRREKWTVRQEHRLGRSSLTAEIEQVEVPEYAVRNDWDRQHHAVVILRRLAVKCVDSVCDECAGAGYCHGLVEHRAVVQVQIAAMPRRVLEGSQLV